MNARSALCGINENAIFKRNLVTAGAPVLHSFHIHIYPLLFQLLTSGLREQAINVTPSWRGILKLLRYLSLNMTCSLIKALGKLLLVRTDNFR